MTINLQAQIRQQEAAVKQAKLLVAAGRARPERLEAAQNELNRLRAQDGEPAPPPQRTSRRTRAILTDVAADPVQLRQQSLSEEAQRIRKEQADLSNLLHKVPADQPCPELTSRILALHEQVESLWDEKLFMERNTHDGPAKLAHDQAPTPRTVQQLTNKATLTVQIQQLREKRSKLKRKLENPKASDSRRAVWTVELAQTEAHIEELITQRTLL